jgi:hypothetical protein
MPSKYLVHDNGGRPFQVHISTKPKKIEIYEQSEFDEELEPTGWKKLVKRITNFQRVFIGNDPWLSGVKGNSILVQITDQKYIYIGWEIFSFTLPRGEKIKKYYSPIGNSDVVYPYAVTDKNTYLLIEYVSIPTQMISANSRDPYDYYYFQVPQEKKKCVAAPIKYKILHPRINYKDILKQVKNKK